MNNNTKCDLALRIRQLKAALQISFRDIQFISAYHDKILLPYTGDLPQVIQQYIIYVHTRDRTFYLAIRYNFS